MRTLELKILPPVLLLITLLLMWLISAGTPSFAFQFPLRRVIPPAIALVGVVIAISGAIAFRKARTTVNPTKPHAASSLVTTGIYRFTRNPMYVGLALLSLAWGTWLANPLALLPIPVFVFYLTRYQIRPEERALQSLFGDEFAAYSARVRRWF